jgi:hypothetical protein
LRRSLTLLAAAAALPMVAGAPAAAQTPDAPPRPPGEARPATLPELDAACQHGRQPAACAEASKMRAEILSAGFLVPDPPPMATGDGGAPPEGRPEPPPPPPPILMPGP